MTNPLTQHESRFIKAYSNFPVGRYLSLIIVRKTESEVVFRTEGSGEELSKEFVRAGERDDTIITRALMTKRKQVAVERRIGRELLRDSGLLYFVGGQSSGDPSDMCGLNRNKPCGRCIDCYLYGYAVGKGGEDIGAQKSRVITDDAFSILPASVVTGKRTFSGIFENGTMRDPLTGDPSRSLVPLDPYVKPETHFLEIETLKDVTLGEWVYVMGNVLRSTRYGAVSSRQGRIRNTLAGVVFSNCEIFSNLELTQRVYDLLKAKDAELNFPLRDVDVLDAAATATQSLMGGVASAKPQVLGLDDAAKVQRAVVGVYRDPARVAALLRATEKGYATDRKAAEAAHAEVVRLLEAAEEAGNDDV
ncbi:MAG: type I-D CRISPR-associated protein Cas7/Csc2 [Chloroflexi bacterium]|nr:type I-D CRISPR-associated protein Cas7/Csc2 [Chloroflexota bacterium]